MKVWNPFSGTRDPIIPGERKTMACMPSGSIRSAASSSQAQPYQAAQKKDEGQPAYQERGR